MSVIGNFLKFIKKIFPGIKSKKHYSPNIIVTGKGNNKLVNDQSQRTQNITINVNILSDNDKNFLLNSLPELVESGDSSLLLTKETNKGVADFVKAKKAKLLILLKKFTIIFQKVIFLLLERQTT